MIYCSLGLKELMQQMASASAAKASPPINELYVLAAYLIMYQAHAVGMLS